MEIGIGIIVVVVVVLLYAVVIYNKLIELKNRAANGFSQIEVQLKRRYDLIPNLVEVAKSYMTHERETLESVIAARDSASQLLSQFAGNLTDATAASAFAAAEGSLGSMLSGMKIAVEAYPDLKASANMLQLNEEITSTENKIGFSRQAYNDGVNEYNTYKQSFPQILFAGIFGHRVDMSFLEFAEAEKLQEAPKVSF